MKILILEVSLPAILIGAILFVRLYWKIKYPTPKALGRVLPKLCVVDADEILRYKEVFQDEWTTKPHLRRALRRNQIKINWGYFSQMRSNAFCFQQVARFEDLKIDPGKSSFEYDTRELTIENILDESARLRSEIFSARIDLLKRALFGGLIDQERLDTLLGKYKALEHEMVELANMAKDTTCRDMLIERLGLTNWKIFDGGSTPESA